MEKYEVSSERGEETIEAETIWDAAGEFAASAAGFDCDEPCWDPFSFTVNDKEFTAELVSICSGGGGSGTVKVTIEHEEKLFDDCGCEIGD